MAQQHSDEIVKSTRFVFTRCSVADHFYLFSRGTNNSRLESRFIVVWRFTFPNNTTTTATIMNDEQLLTNIKEKRLLPIHFLVILCPVMLCCISNVLLSLVLLTCKHSFYYIEDLGSYYSFVVVFDSIIVLALMCTLTWRAPVCLATVTPRVFCGWHCRSV